MNGRVLKFVAADPHLFPEDRISVRTGVSRCTSCLTTVDLETYLALDTLCADCDAKDEPVAQISTRSFRPYDRDEVREEIGRRGRAGA
jgi:hypothetical protein